MYKIVALDLDGTLTDSHKNLPEKNRNAILEAQSKGVRIALVSGRPRYGIQPIADELNLKDNGGFVLAFNGGVAIDCASGSVISSMSISEDLLPDLYADSIQNDAVILSYDNDAIVSESDSDSYILKEAYLNRMPIRKVSSFVEHFNHPVPKCLIVGEPNRLAETERVLAQKYEDRLNVFRSEPYFLEIVPLGIDKSKALSKLLSKLGLSREELVAMGDGYNDLSMIEYAGLGVAMANAQDVVKAAADVVTARTNDEAGVEEALRKYVI